MDQKEARIPGVVLGGGCGFGIHNRCIRMVTVFSASESLTAANALGWFADPHWHGKRPGPDPVLDVSVVGDAQMARASGPGDRVAQAQLRPAERVNAVT